MKVVISKLIENSTCSWCEKQAKETVVATFEGGMFRESELCWKCCQQAYKNQFKQRSQIEEESEN